MTSPDPHDDDLLTPQEAAQMLGVRAATLAQWANQERLTATRTSSGRRYLLSEIRYLHEVDVEACAAEAQLTEKAFQLYDQGQNALKVSEKLDINYRVARRILRPRIASRYGKPKGVSNPIGDKEIEETPLARYQRKGYSPAQAQRLARWEADASA